MGHRRRRDRGGEGRWAACKVRHRWSDSKLRDVPMATSVFFVRARSRRARVAALAAVLERRRGSSRGCADVRSPRPRRLHRSGGRSRPISARVADRGMVPLTPWSIQPFAPSQARELPRDRGAPVASAVRRRQWRGQRERRRSCPTTTGATDREFGVSVSGWRRTDVGRARTHRRCSARRVGVVGRLCMHS